MKRRNLLAVGIAVGVTVLSLSAPASYAQAWPEKPITFVVPFAPGGGTDAFARPMAVQLSEQLGKSVLIDNRAGAGGTIGAAIAAKAAPDGYTFLVGAVHHTIAPAMYPKLDYNIEKDFVPVAVLALVPQVVVVNPSRVKVDDLKGLIDYAKKNPDKLNFGSAGNGTSHHLAGELFKIQTGTKMVHVPYKGAGPAMQDLLAGQIDMMFDGMGTSAAQIKGGKLKALAIAAPNRVAGFETVPTSKEAGVANYEVSTWYAVWAVKGTPQPMIDRLHKEIDKAAATQRIKDVWASQAATFPGFTQAQFGKFVSDEIARWGKVVKESGAKLD